MTDNQILALFELVVENINELVETTNKLEKRIDTLFDIVEEKGDE